MLNLLTYLFIITDSALLCIQTGLVDDNHYENLQLAQREVQDNSDEIIDNTQNERIMMKYIIQIVKSGNIEEVYSDVNKYFLFHQTCVMNVLFKTKWKKLNIT